jgi:membrane protein YqaA with SNARE-associated domain|tara:strand:- start:1005 stop:1454 length:450 start_codon:yes stop_codon:yes gene_type:complete
MENLAEWGYIGLFIASFLAATIIPFSSELVLSILIANNYDLTTSLIVASIGNWMGGLSSYLIGRLGSWDTIEKYLRVKRDKILLWKKKIDSWGGLLAFLCWLPVVGDPIAIALGFFRTNILTVAIFMLVGKFVRYFVWAMITYVGFSLL